MEACEIDQFEVHLRAVLGLPVPPPKMKVGAAIMVNILGADAGMSATKAMMKTALSIPGAGRVHIHLILVLLNHIQNRNSLVWESGK
jgi:phosphoribosylaminoimidazole carboxylase (NCAIR synthetase)